MKTAAMVLGIIGGILALVFVGLVGFWAGRVYGEIGGFLGLGGLGIEMIVLSLGLPVLGLIGGTIVRSRAILGGTLMLASGAVILTWLGFQSGTLVAAVPLVLGGILGLVVGVRQEPEAIA